MNTGTPSILTLILSGLVSGVVVALLNYLLTRKKTQLEIKKLELETERIRVEISKSVEDISATVNYKLANAEEQIIYDISKGHGGYDFRVQPAVELVTIVAFYALPVLLLGAGIYYNSVALCLLGILSAGFVWIWEEGRGSRKKRQ